MRVFNLLTVILSVVTTTIAATTTTSVPYGSLCLGILGNIYEFKGGNCTTSYRKASCYCKDERFVESVVSCIEKYVANVTASKRNATRATAYKTVTATCKKLNTTVLQKYQKNIGNLPIYYGKTSGKKPGHWPVKSAFALTNKELTDAVKAYKTPLNNSKLNRYYGSALLGYWAGILALTFIFHTLARLFPSVTIRCSNTKIGRIYRKYLQLYCSNFTLITVMHMLMIVGFIILTVLLTFCNIPIYNPNYNYRYSSVANYGNALGVRTGIYAIFIAPLFFLFAARNNFLQYFTGWTQEQFLIFHRWIARVCVLLLVAHAIAYTLGRTPLGTYHRSWSAAYWRWGIVGLAFGCFILVQAMKFIRRAYYETFLVLHIIAAIFFLVGGYYHLKLIGAKTTLNFYYACFAVWGFDRFMRMVRIAYLGIHKCRVTLVHENMLLVTMNKPKWWPSKTAPGMYVFVHFLKFSYFWQSHPLTLTYSSQDRTQIKLYFRVYSGISKTIANSVELSEERGMDIYAMLDGPYGEKFLLNNYGEYLFIAGGSGVTLAHAYIQNILDRDSFKEKSKITLYWIVSNSAPLYWFKDELDYLRNEAGVDVYVYISNRNSNSLGTVGSVKQIVSNTEKDEAKVYVNQESASISDTDDEKTQNNTSSGLVMDNSSEHFSFVHNERLNVPSIIEEHIVKSEDKLAITCCGPASLHNSARNSVFQNINKTKNFVNYFEETYF